MRKIYIIYKIENEERKLYSMTDSLPSFLRMTEGLRKRDLEYDTDEVFEKDLDEELLDHWNYITSGMED